jgi:peptidoglycan hydrolase-like protein with peptidoglycan-binding domain
MPTHEFWPPRVLCEGMIGTDVKVLHVLLEAWGYGTTDAQYEFGSYLDTKLRAFQKDHGLKADGIAGPLTWAALLKITSF